MLFLETCSFLSVVRYEHILIECSEFMKGELSLVVMVVMKLMV